MTIGGKKVIEVPHDIGYVEDIRGNYWLVMHYHDRAVAYPLKHGQLDIKGPVVEENHNKLMKTIRVEEGEK